MDIDLKLCLLPGIDDEIPKVDENLETPLTWLDYPHGITKAHDLSRYHHFCNLAVQLHIVFPKSIRGLLMSETNHNASRYRSAHLGKCYTIATLQSEKKLLC